MPQNYTPEFKKKIVRLRLEEGRTINSITTEYGISKESVRRWCNEFQKECQAQSLQIPSSVNEAEIMKDNLRLHRELAASAAWHLPECLLKRSETPKDGLLCPKGSGKNAD